MYDTGTKRVQEETWQCGYSHPLGSGRKVWVERNERCYDHVPEIVLSENDDYKHLWDFSIPPDHEIGARRLDLVIIYKRNKSCQNMEVAIPEDGPGREKEDEKAEKYQDLFEKFENCRM